MKLIYVCSPYRGDVELNVARACRYCRFVYTQGAVPFAPHLHNTQFLDDFIPNEREAGILLGLHMLQHCEELWCFGSKLSEGMTAEIRMAQQLKIPIRFFNDKCEEVVTDESVAGTEPTGRREAV